MAITKNKAREFLRDLGELCRNYQIVIRTSCDPSDLRPYADEIDESEMVKGGFAATFYDRNGVTYLDGLEFDPDAPQEGALRE